MAKKGYGYFYFFDENGVIQMRKLTGKKRKEVLKNYLRRRSGREMRVETISNAFNVSVRSMQWTKSMWLSYCLKACTNRGKLTRQRMKTCLKKKGIISKKSII